MELTPRQFDRELTLKELLAGLPAGKLQQILEAMFGCGFRLTTAGGQVVAGSAEPGTATTHSPIRYELESVGNLETASADPEKIKAAVLLIELLLHSAARYYMASALHIEAIDADYEALQKKHAALVISETRYRELAASLELRVQQQVAVIEAAQRQLYQTEKMVSVGQLAAGVAHEINNPVGFIKSNLNTAKKYVQQFAQLAVLVNSSPDSAIAKGWRQADLDFVIQDFSDLLGESIAGTERVARIVADLKDFSNIDHTEIQVVNINDNIRSVCNMATHELSKTADLLFDLGELPKQKCHPGRINQALLNVLLNAAQAMPERGQIRIRSEYRDGLTSVQISDNGHGMAESTLARVFDPFFTTREVGKGTGLGLTVARDIVTAHDGDILIQSEPGKGTTVTIHLPVG